MAKKKASAKSGGKKSSIKKKAAPKKKARALESADAPVIIDDGGSTRITQVLHTLPGLAGKDKKHKPSGAFQGGAVGIINEHGDFVTLASFRPNIKQLDATSQWQSLLFHKETGNWILALSAASNVTVQNGVQPVYTVTNAGTFEYVKIDNVAVKGTVPGRTAVVLNFRP